jgi:hypothetical protein
MGPVEYRIARVLGSGRAVDIETGRQRRGPAIKAAQRYANQDGQVYVVRESRFDGKRWHGDTDHETVYPNGDAS